MCASFLFGQKIKGRKIKKMRFSAPKTKKKTKFGRPLTDIVTRKIIRPNDVSRIPAYQDGRIKSNVHCVEKRNTHTITATLSQC